MIVPDLSFWFDLEPYSLGSVRKNALLTDSLSQLTAWHASNCKEYSRIVSYMAPELKNFKKVEDIPFLPARIFKEFELKSIANKDIFKIMTSSGTTGQSVSKIFLDRETALIQTKILSLLMRNLLGKKRLPMLIVDSANVIKDRNSFSARGAGILGFSMFGKSTTYALNKNMELDLDAIYKFAEGARGNTIFLFGFTYMIWSHFIKPLLKKKISLPFKDVIILHGGGWKKIQDEAVTNKEFTSTLKSVINVKRVVNYYGMVEQTGSLFMECEEGNLHSPIYADVIIRSPNNFEVATNGEEGIIEVLSMAPISYPGHAILTEDLGVVLGEDNCTCGRLGKYFKVSGRIPAAEIRGCSDTYEYSG